MKHNVLNKKDYSISAIRLFAIVSIVTCHILQYMNLELAWWFNVGVQVFLCISGWLYGGKRIDDSLSFIKKQFKKILLDYYIVIIPVLVLYCFFESEIMSKSLIFNVLICKQTLPGGGHLWFVATILFCYILTPMLAKIYDNYDSEKIQNWFGVTIAILVGYHIIGMAYIPYFEVAKINCFVLGFALRRLQNKKVREKFCVYAGLIVLTLFFNGIQIIHTYIKPLPLPLFLVDRWSLFCNYAHTFLGISLFILFYAILNNIKFHKIIIRFLKVAVKYSYNIYLVHQFWILSSATLMEKSPFLVINIFLIIGATIISAGIVKLVHEILLYIFDKFSYCIIQIKA